MKDAWRHFIAEFIGTFALVFIGSGAIMSTATADPRVALIAVAIAHGLVLSIMVTALMRISGHFNPAITLGFLFLPGMRDIEGTAESDPSAGSSAMFPGAPELTSSSVLR